MTQHEFEKMGTELVNLFLNLDDEYKIDKFEHMRKDALVKIMTTFTKQAALIVVSELKSKNHSLGRKLILISAIFNCCK